MGSSIKTCGIFICYRQDDAQAWALLLHDHLVDAFGKTNVFLDKDSLHAGNWREQIQQALSGCSTVIVVIGSRWLTLMDGHGKNRLDDPNDIHRQEIAIALAMEEVTVIPVRVGGTSMPRCEELPCDIRTLIDQQSRQLSDNTAHLALDLETLVADIEQATGLTAKRHPCITQLQSPKHEPSLLWTLAQALILVPVASMVLLIVAEVGLGWSLDVQEQTFVVFIVLLVILGGVWFRNRGAHGEHGKT